MSRNITNSSNNKGVDRFIQLLDCPSSYTAPGDVPVINSTNDGLVFEPNTGGGANRLTDLVDCPNTISSNNKAVLTANPGTNATIWRQPAFNDLSDISGTYTSQANKTIVVNGTGSGLTYADKNNLTTFLQLSDTPNSYVGEGDKFVKVRSNETGLHFVAGGGTVNVGLLQLDDNTGIVNYSNPSIGTVPQANNSNSGFLLDTLLNVQQMTPRLIQNFNGFSYPSGKPTFNYNTGDAVYPLETHLFGVFRPNYNDPGTPYLNFFWTSIQPSGGSTMYGPDNAGLDIEPAFEGLTQNHHSCGVKLFPFNNKLIPSPLPPSDYSNWVMDVEINFNARLELSNMTNKVFLIYINTPDFLDILDADVTLDKEDKARASDYNWTQLISSDTECIVNISKVLTIPCWDNLLNRQPIINVFMKAVDSNFNEQGFTVDTYRYINCMYKIIGCRYTSRNLTVNVPGTYW